MAEITNEIDWLKACNHLVLENYADAEAWGWDGCGNIGGSDVEREAGKLYMLGRKEFYEYHNPIHRAIFGCLCWHMDPEFPPEGAIPSWAMENHGVEHYRKQLENLFLEYDCPLSWIPDADEEPKSQTIDVEVETPATLATATTLATPVEEQEPELDVRPEFLPVKSLLDNLSDRVYVHRVGVERCLRVVQEQSSTLQGLNPGTFDGDELDLYLRLCFQEETLEERIKTERRQRLLLANPEELVFLDLLRLIYINALEKNINGYQAASTQMRRRFGKTEQALKPDLLKLLRDEHAESAYSVGAVDLNKIHSLEYALEGFIPNEEVTHVFAPWGDGKTALALGMTKALIKGTGFLDQQVGREPQSVLYINTDAGAGRFKSAFEELNMDSDQRFTSGEWLTVWAPDASQGKEGWSASLSNFIALREAIEDGGYGVVIIDSVKGMLSGTGYDYQDNQTVNQMVKMLREVIAMPCECAVVLINHKGTDEKEGAGAKAWSEATGQVIELKTPQGKDKQPLKHLREVIIRKDSIGGRRRMFTKLENGEHVVTEGTEVVKDGTDLVLQWFKSKAVAGKPKWQRKDVIAEESGLVPEVSVPTVDRALKALSGHAGQLKKLKGGWYELKAQHS